MVMSSSTFFVLAVSCLIIGINGKPWSFFDPFEDIFDPPKQKISAGPPSNSATNPPAAPAESKSKSKSDETEMRQMIQEEMKKFQASSDSEPVPAQPAPEQPAPVQPAKSATTENPADMIRRIVAEEIAKAMPPAPAPATTAPQTPPVPMWKSWANTKYWAKQPGPNGEAPPGFVGSLQSRFGPSGASNSDVAPTGSPGWVWKQMSSKWAKGGPTDPDPTIVPPAQVVVSGDWDIVLPPQSQPKTKTT